jgi:hypothetical protein
MNLKIEIVAFPQFCPIVVTFLPWMLYKLKSGHLEINPLQYPTGLRTFFFNPTPKLTSYTLTKNGHGYRFKYIHEGTKDRLMGVFILMDD